MDIYLGNKEGVELYSDLGELENIALIGTAGVGKTVYISRVLRETMERYSPSEVKFIIHDDKGVEYRAIKDSPFLLSPITTHANSSDVVSALARLEEANHQVLVVLDDMADLLYRVVGLEDQILSIIKGKFKNIHFLFVSQNVRHPFVELLKLSKTKLLYQTIGENPFLQGHKGDMKWEEPGDVLLSHDDKWTKLHQTVKGAYYLRKTND